jgi:sporulation protein YlmC with PRC-barrel domain
METIVNFVGEFSDMIKKSMNETRKAIGKQVVDSTAGRKGVCIDRITDFSGQKISFLGVKYDKRELDKIDALDKDVLVIKGEKSKFFVSMDDVSAVGDSIILLKSKLGTPEILPEKVKTSDIYKRYNLALETISTILPSAVGKPVEIKENDKKWISKLIGE